MSIVAKCTRPEYKHHPPFYNTLGQSPCDIATALRKACTNDAEFNLSLNDTTYHGPLTETEPTPCVCSTVYYSLLSACLYCQRQPFNSWADHSKDCQDPSISCFPKPIPAGTPVPHYAYLDVVARGCFNAHAARTACGAESSPIPPIPSTTSAGVTVSTETFTPVSTEAAVSTTLAPTHRPSTAKGRSTILIAAVVEGVVGFLVLLAIVGLILWFFKFRRKRATVILRSPSRSPPIYAEQPFVDQFSVGRYSSLDTPTRTP